MSLKFDGEDDVAVAVVCVWTCVDLCVCVCGLVSVPEMVGGDSQVWVVCGRAVAASMLLSPYQHFRYDGRSLMLTDCWCKRIPASVTIHTVFTFWISSHILPSFPGVQVKCFIEEVPDETMVTGKFHPLEYQDRELPLHLCVVDLPIPDPPHLAVAWCSVYQCSSHLCHPVYRSSPLPVAAMRTVCIDAAFLGIAPNSVWAHAHTVLASTPFWYPLSAGKYRVQKPNADGTFSDGEDGSQGIGMHVKVRTGGCVPIPAPIPTCACACIARTVHGLFAGLPLL
jgi:hypothetical protein